MIGNQPSLTNNAVARTISVTATAGQTLFTVTGGYRINQLGVFRNGTRLVDALDYNARDGATVTLLSPANASDVLEFQVFDDFRVADALNVNSGGTVNGAVTIVSAATTALLVEGNARITGILTVGSSSITFDGTNNSINIGSVSIAETGITGGTSDIVTRNITGVAATFTGNVSIAGTLTYEDVTNIDSVGLITARSGIVLTGGNVTLGTGVTASGSTANTFTLSTNGSERLRVDSSGNINVDSGGVYYDAVNNRLAVGTTSGVGKLTVYTSTAYTPGTNFNDGCLLVGNGTATTGNIAISYDNTNGAAFTSLLPGTAWKDINYGANQHIFSAGGFERARIDSSGRLLVGTSSVSGSSGTAPYARIQVQGNAFSSTTQGAIAIKHGSAPGSIGADSTVGSIAFAANNDGEYAWIDCVADGTGGTNDYPGRLVFSVTRDGQASPTSAMRITNSGRTVVLGNTNVFDAYSEQGAGTSYELFIGGHSATTTVPGSGTTSFRVFTNGNVQNTNNSYGSLSDAKLKENIVDAGSQWDDLKSFRVRKYNFKEETGQQTHTQIGLVAQEVELVSPGLVSESPDRDSNGNDLGTVTKSVNYSVLYMKAVKALQEAMERIEQLEAKVAALESV